MSVAAAYLGCLQAQGQVLSPDPSKILGFDKQWAADRTVSLLLSRSRGNTVSRAIGQHDQLQTQGRTALPMLPFDSVLNVLSPRLEIDHMYVY